jgi:hypothetical protein
LIAIKKLINPFFLNHSVNFHLSEYLKHFLLPIYCLVVITIMADQYFIILVIHHNFRSQLPKLFLKIYYFLKMNVLIEKFHFVNAINLFLQVSLNFKNFLRTNCFFQTYYIQNLSSSFKIFIGSCFEINF